MSTCVDLSQSAVLEWQWDSETRCLATPDPSNTSIQFTIRLESVSPDVVHAHFEICIPVKLKDKGASAIYLRLSPSSITTFQHSSSTIPSDVIKRALNCTISDRLHFQLDTKPTLLVPADAREPIVAARPRSGKIIDDLHQLSQITSLSIYIKDTIISNNQLESITNGVSQRYLKSFPSPDFDISRMYGGKGAKTITLPDPDPKPPSYTEHTPPPYTKPESLPSAIDPPDTRKRARQNSDGESSISQVWEELQKMQKRMVAVDTLQQEIRDLRVHNTKLQEDLTSLQKSHHDLEEEVCSLRLANADKADMEDVDRIEMLDTIAALTSKVDYLDRGKDDDAFIERVLLEIRLRLAGG
ncbi:hypothetical protein FGRMN_2797 [Fusarium graminum]|nr:hypothetical protein FGRMN_2797 [Fusarium graminum]